MILRTQRSRNVFHRAPSRRIHAPGKHLYDMILCEARKIYQGCRCEECEFLLFTPTIPSGTDRLEVIPFLESISNVHDVLYRGTRELGTMSPNEN